MDKKIVRQAKKGDSDAFASLIGQCETSMYKAAKAILRSEDDVSDAMQESILVAWEKLDTLRRDELFKTWLMRIVINESNKIYRKRQTMIPEAEMAEFQEWESGYSSVEWKMFLEELDEKHRIVIVLYYIEGFKIREILEILQIGQSAVKMRLTKARKILANIYDRKEKQNETISKSDTGNKKRNGNAGGNKEKSTENAWRTSRMEFGEDGRRMAE